MKKFRIVVDRIYTTTIEVEASNIDLLNQTVNNPTDNQRDRSEEIWDMIFDQELHQMDVKTNDALIYEIKKTNA